MATYPLDTLACTITSAGISAPSYDDIYLSLVASFQGIYGSDVVLTADTQDGQWLAILAKGFNDCNNATIAAYNSFSPATAQGNGLSSNVKINGLKRQSDSTSSCDVTIGGTAGTIITDGVIKDTADYLWSLPASVTIPPASVITVTATCQTPGAITAAIGTLIKINTPTLGWLTVTNAVAASPGAAQETDGQLRTRQSTSTAISAITPMESIAAAVEAISGVTRVNWDENTTSTTNANGTPGHSFALVVEGGDATTIAQTIASKKLGAGTAGAVTITVIDSKGVPSTINFDTPTYKRIVVNVSIKALAGYTVTIGNALVAAIAAYINGLAIGAEVDLNNVVTEGIDGSGGKGKFKIPPGGLTMAIYGSTPTQADIAIAFNESATCVVADVNLSLVS